ncbi:hypothetical protein DYU11_22440 [Fibrisoma montanum]|uniref:Uncharacterized protein n=1 Tax=Fibrisoma montanum TaxID=2305895 RepID=A0A418M1V8_9BACT|nr:hypothetical protein [Fibrisoma montanum]RIV19691.1 hypothetical protein DYU11_22440 [Fibrisoma montanum]
MKINCLRGFFAVLLLTGSLSCRPAIEPMGPLSSPLRKANYVYTKADHDFYSACAVLADEPVVIEKGCLPGGVPLFDGPSKAILYLLNGQPTRDRKAVKAVFMEHHINEVLLQEKQANGQKLVVINYEKQQLSANYQLDKTAKSKK